jgi:membrane-associated phospholipid phosphatase
VRSLINLLIVLLPLSFPSYCSCQQDPGGLDVTLFRRINNGRSEFLGKVVDVNDDLVLPLSIATPLGFFSYGELAKSEHETDTGLLTGLSEVVSFGIGQGLKKIVRRERPYARLANVHFADAELSDPYSFPSGHSTVSFAIATSLSLRYPKPSVYIPLHLWALFVGYGRVYLGLHYPSDVLAGAAIGSGTALLVHLFEDDILGLKTRILGKSGKGTSGLQGLSVRIVPLWEGGLLQLCYHL